MSKLNFFYVLFVLVFHNQALGSSIELRKTNSMFSTGEFLTSCQNNLACKIDLGLNLTSLSLESFNQLQSPSIIGTVSYSTASGAAYECDILANLKLKLGKTYTSQLINPIYCYQYAPKNTLIGLDVFKNQKIFWDNNKNSITFNYVPNDNKGLWDFTVDSFGHIIIPVRFSRTGSAVDSFIDSGSAASLISRDLLVSYPDSFYIVSKADSGITDGTGNSLKSERCISNTYINEVVIVAPYLMAVDFKPIQKFMGPEVMALIGFNIIKEKNWYFDFENQQWFVEDF